MALTSCSEDNSSSKTVLQGTTTQLVMIEQNDDTNCVNGGWKLVTGIDSDGNGLLEGDEISATQYDPDCLALEEPDEDVVGTFTIVTKGGNFAADASDDNGYGGRGGDLEIYIERDEDYEDNVRGDIEIKKTGLADASFTFPDVTTNLGTNGKVISTSITVSVNDSPSGASQFFHTNSSTSDNNLYYYDGLADPTTDTVVTGIQIQEGVTVTFEPNYTTYVRLEFEADVHNEGIITTSKDASNNRVDMRVYCSVFYGGSSSQIALTGDISGDIGTDGGYFRLYRTEGYGGFFNRGIINTSGGNSQNDGDAGDAGYVYLYPNDTGYYVYNSGAISAIGGSAPQDGNGNGGNGNYVQMYIGYSGYNSGNINTSGGSGYDGGNGGYMELYAYTGNFLNSGNLTSAGGNAYGYSNSQSDLRGGSINIYAYGGSIINSGNVTTTGGNATWGYGGYGGNLRFEVNDFDNDDVFVYQPAGDIIISGNMNTSGGASKYAYGSSGASDGGDINIYSYPEYIQEGQKIQLLGYDSITLDGGSGAYSGGSAGQLYFYQYGDFGTGGIYNYADVYARGGNQLSDANGRGGSGGYVELSTYADDYYSYTGGRSIAVNYGDLYLSGGNGATGDGGDSGPVRIYGYHRAENQGNITSNGGNADASGDGGDATDGDSILIWSVSGSGINKGNITANGGSASRTGYNAGHGAEFAVKGSTATVTGTINLQGGDNGSGYGGDGGQGVLFASDSSSFSGSFDVSGGTGADATADGCNGSFWMDGYNLESNTTCNNKK